VAYFQNTGNSVSEIEVLKYVDEKIERMQLGRCVVPVDSRRIGTYD
jgi:hypothetical protein